MTNIKEKFSNGFLKYLLSSMLYFVLLLLLFISIPGEGGTRSQGFPFFFIFLSYLWVPIGLIIGFITGIAMILVNRSLPAMNKILVLLLNIVLPMIVASLFLTLTMTKTQLVDNPACVKRISEINPYLSINNVVTKELDRDKNNELDTVRVDFDIIYTGEKTLNTFGYVELNSPTKERQRFMYQWDGLPDEAYPNLFPGITLNKGSTHIIRYLDIQGYVPLDMLSKSTEQILTIWLRYDINQQGNCTCIMCTDDVFVITKHTENTYFDLSRFKPNPFTLKEYRKFENKDSL